MECFHPLYIRGPDPVPCGKCFACQSNRRQEWFMRLKYEMLDNLCSYTVTLTYDNEHLPKSVEWNPFDPFNPFFNEKNHFWYHPYVYEHVQLFFKRLRKSGYKFRYFGVAEYGSHTARPHYHIIFFFKENINQLHFANDVFSQWPYGSQIKIDSTNDDCIGYCTKYCLKPYNSNQPTPKMFCSKVPGIGFSYLSFSKYQTLTYLYNHNTDVLNTVVGRRRIPRYYRDKFTTESMRFWAKKNIQNLVALKTSKDELLAKSKNITLNEFKRLKREVFTDRVLKQIKNSKI